MNNDKKKDTSLSPKALRLKELREKNYRLQMSSETGKRDKGKKGKDELK